MGTISRSYGITYNGVEFGGSSSTYVLTSPIQRSSTYEAEIIRATVRVDGTSSTLNQLCEDLLSAIRSPRKNLTLAQGISTTWTESTNAISITAEARRVENSRFNSRTMREYELTFTVLKTADDAADEGIREYTFSVVQGLNGARVVTMTIDFTQYGGSTASEIYDSEYDTLSAAILLIATADNTIEWKEGERVIDRARFDKTIRVTSSFTEQIFYENQDELYEAGVRGKSFAINQISTQRGGQAVQGASTPTIVEAKVEILLDKDITQDLKTFYQSKVELYVRHYMADQGIDVVSSGANDARVMNESVRFDPVANALRGDYVFVVDAVSDTIAAKVDARYEYSPPVKKVPTYEANGMGRLRLPAPGAAAYTITASAVVYGLPGQAEGVARSLLSPPTKTTFGGSFRAVDGRPLSRQQYNDIGISGGGWTFEGESGPHYVGPEYDDASPQRETSGCTVAQLWDYDLDPQNINGGSFERGN